MDIAPLDPRHPEHLLELHRLLRAAYTVEADLLRCTDFPPLRESMEALRDTREQFIGAWERGALVGALGFETGAGPVTLTRLAVAPDWFRRRVASQLMDCLIRTFEARDLAVATGAENAPAIQLYEKYGFRITRRWEAPEGIPLVLLERLLPGNAPILDRPGNPEPDEVR